MRSRVKNWEVPQGSESHRPNGPGIITPTYRISLEYLALERRAVTPTKMLLSGVKLACYRMWLRDGTLPHFTAGRYVCRDIHTILFDTMIYM